MTGGLVSLQGMIIGAVDGVHITASTPIDPAQWADGMPWHWKPESLAVIKPLTPPSAWALSRATKHGGRPMRVLVTGAGGFIGGHLVRRLLEQGDQVRAVDNRPFTEWKQVHYDAENRVMDLMHQVSCRQAAEGQDWVYHLAAQSGGMGYITTHRIDCMENAVIDAHMLRASLQEGCERFYFASSACVYPVSRQQDTVAPALAEDWVWPADPEPGYGLSKLHTEQMCLFYAEDFGLNVRIGRHQSIFGEHCWYEGGREKAPTAICRKVAQAKLAGQHFIPVWGDGTRARDFVYISDAIDAITGIMASDYGKPLNLGTGVVTTIAELAEMVSGIAGWEVELREVPGPLGVQARTSDNSLMQAHASWKYTVSMREGLERTYPWVEGEVARHLRSQAEDEMSGRLRLR